MAIVKRNRSHPQISFNPFSLFVVSSVAIHGLVLWGFTFSGRSRITEEEVTPIDFVIVPPEETSTELPSDTERQAAENSVAQGDVNPELPTASDKIDSQEAIATPASPTVQPEQAPPVVPPTPQPQAKPTPPPAPPKAIAQTPPPKEVKPNPPVVKEPKVKEPKPVAPQPSAEKSESFVKPPPVTEPKPVAETPLSGKDTSSLPKETPATVTENPFQTDLPSKSEVRETLPQQETPAETTETPFQADLPSKPEPALPPTETPPTKTDPEPVSPVATNVAPEPTPTEPTPPENTSVPETPSESTTAVGAGSASLLEGTQVRSHENSDSTFFNTETNASQQATNTSGIDLNPYYDEIQRRVKQNWQSPAPGDNRHTVLVFSIGRNGQIIGLRIRQSSGSPEVDQKSLDAVQKSAPFDPLPANYPYQQLPIEYHFTINAYIE